MSNDRAGISPQPLDATAAAVLTVCCMVWGTGLVMVKFANMGLPPLFNAGMRSVVALVILFVWARWRRVDIFARDGSLLAGIAMGTCFSLEFVALYIGLEHTAASRATIFLHCAPFIAAAGEHFLVPGHRLSGVRLLGLVAAFIGMAVALGGGLSEGSSTLYGDLLCLAGGVFWGMITITFKTTGLMRIPPEKAMLLQLAVSVPILLGLSALTETRAIGPITPLVAGAFAYTVLFTVVIGYSIWSWMMLKYSAASLHAFTFLTPLFGAIAGAVLLGERVGPLTMLGLVLVAAGIWLVNRPS